MESHLIPAVPSQDQGMGGGVPSTGRLGIFNMGKNWKELDIIWQSLYN